MSSLVIAVVVGSLRRESINRQLAQAVTKLAPSHCEFKFLRIDDLPLYNQDEDSDQAPAVKRLKSEIRAAQGIIFVTPEYNRAIPGVLKNAIDHASRPYGRNAWQGKPAGVLGASIGAIGSAIAQQHLRNSLAYLDMPTLGQPEVFLKIGEGFFDGSGAIASADTRKLLQGWLDKYLAWVRQHAETTSPAVQAI
jgi:chromate reductase